MKIVLAGHILGLNQIGPQCRIFLMCWFVSLLRIKQKETDHHWTILVWIVDTFTVLFSIYTHMNGDAADSQRNEAFGCKRRGGHGQIGARVPPVGPALVAAARRALGRVACKWQETDASRV